MGADLIGYLCYGKQVLEFDRAAVVAATKERQSKLRRWRELHDMGGDYDTEHGIPGVAAALDLEAEYRALTRELGPDEYDLSDAVLERDVDELLNDLLITWDNGYRDSVMRDLLPGGMRAVFAGGTSYGDTPDGTGYTTFKQAELLGLLDLVGIT